MTQLLIKNFLRSRSLIIGLLLLFVTGLVSLHIGKIFLDRQEDIIEKTTHTQEENIERQLKFVDGHIGLLLYYLRFGYANDTPALAGLSIGNRDVHPAVLNVNIRNLEEQKHSSEMMNPFYQLLGNLDFSFVLIYLFPLIIIAFCFNLLSEEKEGGTWNLVLSQSENPLRIIRAKLIIRMLSILIVLCLLLIIGKIYLSIPLDAAFFAFSLISILYIGFWFALSWFITSLQKPSNQNALLLLLTWVMLTIVVPASVNALVVNLYPVPEAYGTVIESRDGYHNKWDEPKEPTIQEFKEYYPQFTKYEHPVGQSFGWFWYYAMQHLGDVAAIEDAEAMTTKLQKRNQFSKTIGYLLPSIHTQFSLNGLSRSDLTNYLNYMHNLEQFHEQKRLHFYPKIFENTPIASENWNQYHLEFFKDNRNINWLAGIAPLAIISLLLLLAAQRNWLMLQ